MRSSTTAATLAVVFSFLSLVLPVLSQTSGSFTAYPACSQSCLVKYYTSSSCNGNLSALCICENLSYLQQSTACVQSMCDAADQNTAWVVADDLCLSAGANMTIFYQGTGRDTPAAVSSSAPAASASTAAAAPNKKLSNGALAGIVVGVVIGLTVLAALTFWFIHNWWTIEEVGPTKSYGGEHGYHRYGPKHTTSTTGGTLTQPYRGSGTDSV